MYQSVGVSNEKNPPGNIYVEKMVDIHTNSAIKP